MQEEVSLTAQASAAGGREQDSKQIGTGLAQQELSQSGKWHLL